MCTEFEHEMKSMVTPVTVYIPKAGNVSLLQGIYPGVYPQQHILHT